MGIVSLELVVAPRFLDQFALELFRSRHSPSEMPIVHSISM